MRSWLVGCLWGVVALVVMNSTPRLFALCCPPKRSTNGHFDVRTQTKVEGDKVTLKHWIEKTEQGQEKIDRRIWVQPQFKPNDPLTDISTIKILEGMEFPQNSTEEHFEWEFDKPDNFDPETHWVYTDFFDDNEDNPDSPGPPEDMNGNNRDRWDYVFVYQPVRLALGDAGSGRICYFSLATQALPGPTRVAAVVDLSGVPAGWEFVSLTPFAPEEEFVLSPDDVLEGEITLRAPNDLSQETLAIVRVDLVNLDKPQINPNNDLEEQLLNRIEHAFIVSNPALETPCALPDRSCVVALSDECRLNEGAIVPSCPVPTLSVWGVVLNAGLLLAVGMVVLLRRWGRRGSPRSSHELGCISALRP